MVAAANHQEQESGVYHYDEMMRLAAFKSAR
jgi:hypothetical protein